MSTPIVTVYGWELHNSTGRSDKFYRLLLVDRVVLVNWGARTSARGQFQAQRVRDTAMAQQYAARLTDEKVAKGYVVTRDMTAFGMSGPAVDELMKLPMIGKHTNPAPETCDAVVKAFKLAADELGTASAEAAR